MDIAKYINEIIGIPAEEGSIEKALLDSLPLYLRKSADFHFLTIDSVKMITAFQTSINATPDMLYKHKALLENHFHFPVVFVFNSIEAYQRKRLIERRISFIVPFKQLYIPGLLLDLRELSNKNSGKKEQFSPSSQVLLLYHLECENLEGILFNEIAAKIGYSNMSVTRAVNELQAFGLCRVFGTKGKAIRFTEQKKDLWNKALAYLKSPVKERIFISNFSGIEGSLLTGEPALANYSDLSVELQNVYAISEKEYQKKKKLKLFTDANSAYGEYCLEIWNYRPDCLTKSKIVDPLSLYLSLKDAEDERIQISLKQIMEKIKW